MSQARRTIMLWGRSGAGKSTQVSELAEYVRITTGKKSLVYTIDKGGVGPMLPLVDLGIVDIVYQEATDPWLFLAKASRGQIRDGNGKWIPADLSQYGMVANESFTGFGDALMNNLAEKAAQGINIGGGGNVSFTVTSDGETIKVGGSNMAMYGICQNRLMDELWRSQKLDVPFVVWTAAASKEDDQNAGGKVIGPAGPGKALTAELPRHCDLCLRIDFIPAQSGKDKRHVIYMGPSVDMAAGNAIALGNTRVSKDAAALLPPTVEPASIVKVLELIDNAEKQALVILKKRLKIN